jgi:tetratricopeptide (TPR) repeat protein
MKFTYKLGLALFVNLAIASGSSFSVVALPIEIPIPQEQSPAQQALEKGVTLFVRGDSVSLKQAISAFEEALKLSRSQNNIALQASSLSYLGQVSYSLKNYQQAIKYYEQSLSLYEGISDRANQAKVLSLVGTVYFDSGDQKKALEYYNQALPILVENNRVNIGSELFVISTLQSIGAIYLNLGQKQQGLDYYVQALAVARQDGLRPWVVDALTSLIDVCLQIDQPKKAIDYANQALSMLESIRNPTRKGKVFYQAGRAYANSGDYQQALEYFDQALVIARQIKSEESVNAIVSAIESSQKSLAKSGGNTKSKPTDAAIQKDAAIQALDAAQKLFMQGDRASLTLAIPKLEKSLELSQKNRQPSLEIVSLVFLGRSYNALSNQKKALEYFSQALVAVRTQSEKNNEASISNYLGNVYAEMGESAKALELYEKALSIWQKLDNKLGEASTLSNMGRLYSDLKDFPKSSNFAQQALSRLKEVPQPSAEKQELEVNTLATIGMAQVNSGEIEKALQTYTQALSIARANQQKTNEPVMLVHIARIYYGLKESQKALDLYEQALLMNGSAGNELFEAKTLNEIGMVLIDLQQYQTAANKFVKSAQIANRLGDHKGESAILNNLGTVYLFHLGARSAALEAFNQALPNTRTVGNKLAEANILGNIAFINATSNREPEAFKLYEQALSLYRAIGNRPRESMTLGNLAKLYQTQSKLTDALQNIDSAIAIIESLRGDLKNDALKTSYFASVQDIYQLKTNILMQLHQQQPTKGYAAAALENSDRSRARVLRELLIQANAKINKDISPTYASRSKSSTNP